METTAIETVQREGAAEAEKARYTEHHGRLAVVEDENVPLCNFTAKIVEEISVDDGSGEVARAFAVEGTLADGQHLPRVRVDAKLFGRLDWISEKWGSRANIYAGRGVKDELRDAIQTLSFPTVTRIFAHTGWREVNGRMVYLHGGGAVGGENVSVELSGNLSRLSLPPPDPAITAKDAVAASLKILDVGPYTTTVPLLATTYLAPVASMLNPDFMLWMFGRTGSMKSTLAALSQQHFGSRFARTSLPIDWLSTGTSIESVLFAAKDAVAVVDDYAPQADKRRQQELERTAQWIIRSVGNRSARSRARHDLTQRPDRPPRGIVISTAEDLPPGHSTVGRLVIVRVDGGSIDTAKLSAVQASSALLSHAMRYFIERLARPGNYEEIGKSLATRHAEHVATLRKEATAEQHARQAESLAYLLVGVDLVLDFAVEAGALNKAGADKIREKALVAVREIGRLQTQATVEADPAERFVSALRTMLSAKRIRLEASGGAPKVGGDEDNIVGWTNGDFALLIADEARRQVVEFYRQAGEQFCLSKRALHEALARRGDIQTEGEGRDRRFEVKVRIGEERPRVLRMPIDRLLLPEGEAPIFPPTGWAPHPDSLGFFFRGAELVNEAGLRSRYGL